MFLKMVPHKALIALVAHLLISLAYLDAMSVRLGHPVSQVRRAVPCVLQGDLQESKPANVQLVHWVPIHLDLGCHHVKSALRGS